MSVHLAGSDPLTLTSGLLSAPSKQLANNKQFSSLPPELRGRKTGILQSFTFPQPKWSEITSTILSKYIHFQLILQYIITLHNTDIPSCWCMHEGQRQLEQELKARHHKTEEKSSNRQVTYIQHVLKKKKKQIVLDLEDMDPLAFLTVLDFDSLCHGIRETANPKAVSWTAWTHLVHILSCPY